MNKIICLILLSSTLLAKPVRPKNHFYIAGFGDPFPSHVGINYGYSFYDFLNCGGGMSFPVSSLMTAGLFASAVWPSWKLSPTFGLHLGNVFGKDTDLAPQGGMWAYLHGGIDWQVDKLLNVGMGFNLLLSRSSKKTAGTLPYLNVGWYF